MFLAVQYYRPPFPISKYWESDLDRIAAAGIDAVQLWVTWGWVESEPGLFRFDDYDRLMDGAHDRGLQVILSTIGECQPFWIHRVVPGSGMINHLGQQVRSTPRRENNVGLTPGGCWDNPDVLLRLDGFLDACVQHFRGHPGLLSWDIWNETRWSIHADSHVCYCQHTLARFREWLANRYGDLDGLNRAWQRRYCSWEDVMPGTVPNRMYTELVEFQRFLTWRAGEHMRFRAARARSLDPSHPIGAHGLAPSTYPHGQPHEHPMSRGNDWDHVKELDSYGLSMYPDFFIDDEADFGGRLTAIRSACDERPLWVCELEAAPTGIGFTPGRPVTGPDIYRWLWTCIAYGAKAAILWQWYDELVGPESAAFGLSGNDGNADQRLGAVGMVATEIDRHHDLIDNYVPDPGKVAVVFDQGGYHLDWAQHGVNGGFISSSVNGYVRALEWTGTPYSVLHTGHLTEDHLRHLRLVILPAPLVVAPQAARLLAAWVRAGGTLVAETELDAWSEQGFYRYPGERSFADALGIRGHGRRPADSESVDATVGDSNCTLTASKWIEPVGPSDCDHSHREPGPTFRRSLGRGTVIAIGTFAGYAYHQQRYVGFETFVTGLVRDANAEGTVKLLECANTLVRAGRTSSGHLVFAANHTNRDGHAHILLPQTPSGQPREVNAPVGSSISLSDRTLVVEVRPGEICAAHIPGD